MTQLKSLQNFIKDVKKQAHKKMPKNLPAVYGSIGNREDVDKPHKKMPKIIPTLFGSIGNRKDVNDDKINEDMYETGHVLNRQTGEFEPQKDIEPLSNERHADHLHKKLDEYYHGSVEAHEEKSRNPYLSKYVSDSSYLNRNLINIHNNGESADEKENHFDEDTYHWTKGLDRTIFEHGHPAPHDFHVFTGVGGGFNVENAHKIGYAKLPAYTSTSLSDDIAHGFARLGEKGKKEVIRIKIPKGSSHGTYVGSTGLAGEKEFLLHRNKTLRFVGQPRKFGSTHVYDAEIHDNPGDTDHLKDIEEHIKHEKEFKRKVDDNEITHDEIHDVIDNHLKNPMLSDYVTRHSKLKQDHVEKIISKDNEKLNQSLVTNKNLDKNSIHTILNNGDIVRYSSENLEKLLENPNIEHEHLERLLKHNALNWDHNYKTVMNHHKFDATNIEKYYNEGDNNLKSAIMDSPHATDKMIDHAVESGNNSAIQNLSKQGKLNEKHVENIVKNASNFSIATPSYALSNAKKINQETIDHVTQGDDIYHKNSLAQNQNLSKEHLLKIADSLGNPVHDNYDKSSVAKSLIDNPNSDHDVLHKVWNDLSDAHKASYLRNNDDVPHSILSRAAKTLTGSHLHSLLNHPNIKPEHFDMMLDRDDAEYTHGAIADNHNTPSHILGKIAEKTKNFYTAASIMEHPNVKPEHVEHFSKSSDNDIKEYAEQTMKTMKNESQRVNESFTPKQEGIMNFKNFKRG